MNTEREREREREKAVWSSDADNTLLRILGTCVMLPLTMLAVATTASSVVSPGEWQWVSRWQPLPAQWHVHWRYGTSTSFSTWMGDHQGTPGAVNHGSVYRCWLRSVTDRLYSRYHADTEVKWIKPNQTDSIKRWLLSVVAYIWRHSHVDDSVT